MTVPIKHRPATMRIGGSRESQRGKVVSPPLQQATPVPPAKLLLPLEKELTVDASAIDMQYSEAGHVADSHRQSSYQPEIVRHVELCQRRQVRDSARYSSLRHPVRRKF